MKKLIFVGLSSLMMISSTFAGFSPVAGETLMNCGFTVQDSYHVLEGNIKVDKDTLYNCGFELTEIKELKKKIKPNAKQELMATSSPVNIRKMLEEFEY